MATDDFDRDEIDRLVKQLSEPPKSTALMRLSQEGTDEPAPDASALTPGSRWTSARLLMPAERKNQRDWLVVVSAIRLPALAKIPFSGLQRIPFPPLPKFPFQVPAIDLGALSVRLFVGLGVGLGAAMPYWPYAHAWSWGLLFYFSAVMLVLVAGVWGAKLTWDARLPAAHTLAIGTIVWSLVLLASEAVPRIAYA